MCAMHIPAGDCAKVIYPKYSKHSKYSKHWISTLACTIDHVCSKILSHGLNHRFLSLFKFFGNTL